jgi:hypothetical protein
MIKQFEIIIKVFLLPKFYKKINNFYNLQFIFYSD